MLPKPINPTYNNMAAIPNARDFVKLWAELADGFRKGHPNKELDLPYGPKPRNVFDTFLPTDSPKGLLVFVHGGFWQRMDKTYWSHLAQGALGHGWAVSMMSYTLAPEARIAEITQECGAFIQKTSEKIAGPIVLVGHSAGGHLVTRMISETTPLAPSVLERIQRVMSVSGLHDLKHFMGSDEHPLTQIDEAEAATESPTLLKRGSQAPLALYVGGGELPEFIWQSENMATAWPNTSLVVAEDYNHFDVLNDLTLSGSQMTKDVLGL